MASADRDREILSLNQTMLESVLRGDWDTYAELCSEELSCFEAETNGILAEGLPFHRYYFELAAQQGSEPSHAANASILSKPKSSAASAGVNKPPLDEALAIIWPPAPPSPKEQH